MDTKMALERSPLYANVRNEVGVFTNVFCILDKVEQDQHLQAVGNLYRKIMQREIEFTIGGIFIRTTQTERSDATTGYPLTTIYEYYHI